MFGIFIEGATAKKQTRKVGIVSNDIFAMSDKCLGQISRAGAFFCVLLPCQTHHLKAYTIQITLLIYHCLGKVFLAMSRVHTEGA